MKVVSTHCAPPTATTPAPPAEPKVALEFKIDAVFTADLTDKSSAAYQTLSNQVASAVSPLSCFLFITAIHLTDEQ